MSKRGKDNIFKCILCTRYNSSCYSKSEFIQHLKTHFKNLVVYSCNDCGKNFSTAFDLHEHIKNHFSEILGNDKSYECDVCHKNFKLKTSLNAHIKGHKLNDGQDDMMMMIKRNISNGESSLAVSDSTDDFNIVSTDAIKEEIDYDEENGLDTILSRESHTYQDMSVEDPIHIVVKEENYFI